MNTSTRSFEIVNGPSRDTLFDACKYAYDRQTTISVDFSVAIGYTTPPSQSQSGYIPMKLKNIRIDGIRHKNSSGTKFDLYGFCDADLEIYRYKYTASWKHYQFRATYDSKCRTGEITFVF